MFKYIEKGINIVRREMEYIKKNPWEWASGEEKKNIWNEQFTGGD